MVGVEVVDPEQETPALGVFFQPADGTVRRFVGAAIELSLYWIALPGCAAVGAIGIRIVVVVGLKALRESELVVQNEGADESRGLVPALLQNLGQENAVLRDGLSITPHSMDDRILGREQRCMRRLGRRHRRVGVREAKPLLRKSIDSRCRLELIAVTGEMVCPQRIHGDDDDIGRGSFLRRFEHTAGDDRRTRHKRECPEANA